MTNLKIRNILISGLKLFLIKGAPFEENETCFLYKGVSYTREQTVDDLHQKGKPPNRFTCCGNDVRTY